MHTSWCQLKVKYLSAWKQETQERSMKRIEFAMFKKFCATKLFREGLVRWFLRSGLLHAILKIRFLTSPSLQKVMAELPVEEVINNKIQKLKIKIKIRCKGGTFCEIRCCAIMSWSIFLISQMPNSSAIHCISQYHTGYLNFFSS